MLDALSDAPTCQGNKRWVAIAAMMTPQRWVAIAATARILRRHAKDCSCSAQKACIRRDILRQLRCQASDERNALYNVYLLYCVCIAIFNLDAGLLARSQYTVGPTTGHLDTSFSRFPCAYKQMLRWFPTFQVATTCVSCRPPDLNLLVSNFIFCIHVK